MFYLLNVLRAGLTRLSAHHDSVLIKNWANFIESQAMTMGYKISCYEASSGPNVPYTLKFKADESVYEKITSMISHQAELKIIPEAQIIKKNESGFELIFQNNVHK